MRPADPGPYGRFVLDPDGGLARIVEARDATAEERQIGLCNGGIMAVDSRHLFDLVDQIGNDNAKREFYLTDIVAIARAQGLVCRVAELPAEEVGGVNTRAELAEAEAILQQRLRRRAMEDGATLVAPDTVFLSADTRLGLSPQTSTRMEGPTQSGRVRSRRSRCEPTRSKPAPSTRSLEGT